MQRILGFELIDSLSIAGTLSSQSQLNAIRVYFRISSYLIQTHINYIFHVKAFATDNTASHLKLLIIVNLNFISASKLRIVQRVMPN
jgi:hypothetical protein